MSEPTFSGASVAESGALTPILHRSLKSPYAQKVMALMGYLKQDYLSFVAPKGLPRPIEEKLVGNYCRRIPILQIGADLYCDSELIMKVLAERAGNALLHDYPSAEEASFWVKKIEAEGADLLVKAIAPGEMIWAYFRNMPPNHAWRFITDRVKLAKAKKQRGEVVKLGTPANKAAARHYLEELDRQLMSSTYLLTNDAPSSVDFTAFTMVFFHDAINGLKLADGLTHLLRWYRRMSDFGEGHYREITGAQTLREARSSQPAAIDSGLLQSDRIGQRLTFFNKGFQADMNEGVEGTVVGEDDSRIILRRENADVGVVHLHFPKLDY